MALPTDPSNSPHSIAEGRNHPPGLTAKEYETYLNMIEPLSNSAAQSEPVLTLILNLIALHKPELSVNRDPPEKILEYDPQLKSDIEQRNFAKVLNSRTLFKTPEPSPRPHPLRRARWSLTDPRVVVAAWQEEFVGKPDALESVIRTYMDQLKSYRKYACYAAFTQSSGTGKLRMVDEIAKTIFCLPINLGLSRRRISRLVLVWFSRSQSQHANVRLRRIHAFMYALFEIALGRVKSIGSDTALKYAQIACEFRNSMSEAMEYDEHGGYRRKFYEDVCELAEAILSRKSPEENRPFTTAGGSSTHIVDVQSNTGDVATAARALTTYLSSTLPGGARQSRESQPLVMLCFDEAQLLIEPDEYSSTVLFPDMRHALHMISELPILALFLTKVIQVEQFPPVPQLTQRGTADKAWTLQEVASTYHMVHLGRPLFAAMYDVARDDDELGDLSIEFAGQKLLRHVHPAFQNLNWRQALACISVRIPIKFNPILLSNSYDPEHEVERSMVADHLRLLLYTGIGFTPILTTSASKALLAEAAYRTMVRKRWQRGEAEALYLRKGLNPFKVIAYDLRSSLLDFGSGEIRDPYPGESETDPSAARSDTHDGASKRRIVTVGQFLQSLLGESHYSACAGSLPRVYKSAEDSSTWLGDAFQNGHIYFNHFIKALSSTVVNQNPVGVDIVIPVLFGTVLAKEKATAILIHASNSRHYGAKVQYSVFANMNPYRCGLFAGDVENPPPVLRMDFALASQESTVNPPSQGQGEGQSQQTKKRNNAKFTAYEIWCAGASHETFAVVQEDEDEDIAKVLKQLREPRDILAADNFSEQARHAVRQMQPLVSTKRDHVAQFADPPSKEEYPIAEDADEGNLE
ncbi:hypothetical protein C8T65DRAFT_741918 [Cerioporus squamosus]|nr:hypothetical protein C8T65DRAFT_741918 [Cerioporus squamosus]